MKLKLILATLAVSAFMINEADAQKSGDWANFSRYAKANSEITTSPKAVLFGDSITDHWAKQDPDFFTQNNFVGRGISGQTSSQILVRFRSDVIDLHPKYVAILAGVNDIGMNPPSYIDYKHAFENVVSMCDLAKANKIKPILCTAPPASKIPWRPEAVNGKEEILEFNQMIRDYGKKHKIPVVDYAKVLENAQGTSNTELVPDEIHPNLQGYKVMEELIMKVIK